MQISPQVWPYARKHPMANVFGDNQMEGCYKIPYKHHYILVIASSGMGWDHVSVSVQGTMKRVPNWQEMCFVKDLFFREDETVVQFHPKKSDYVNIHPHVLHLWKKQDHEYELPVTVMV
jgi:hypothetical protein